MRTQCQGCVLIIIYGADNCPAKYVKCGLNINLPIIYLNTKFVIYICTGIKLLIHYCFLGKWN